MEMRSLNDGEVLIRNKVYQTVALRVQKFREAHPDWSIVTQIVHRDADEVVMVATILNDQGRILATGHAEEKRKASQINSTSALENARLLRLVEPWPRRFGGSEFASANEVQNAVHQQNPGINKALTAISEAPSMEALKIVYTAAIRQFKEPGELEKINAAKDKRKSEL
jgi:hypothetical protein